ncbi:MAG TPA: chemotaxis protein CheD [Spirochaetota bacterium]|nr:chemotaxis protein CheD [Spirochaetota bacterium]HPC40605.1 chemotaxis protein CheD [Spirochaetota bacterium]HPL18198.1 chemotaxis protein CheD [Spirochaetota bacterium]HQF07887.1 chemotaxis protein CheD [Spirochaetota bacterium]HQH96446.1 chemotaxis protein CheD [Spirochaetota bacterium]
MDFQLINVGIADYNISSSPDVLRTILGSCVGICLYDSGKKIGGMCHIMLPAMKEQGASVKKYADTAIPLMLDEMKSRGADVSRIQAKIVGGARMFNVSENSMMGEIGNNNVLKVREVLGELAIGIVSEDIGGNYGRTIDFYLDSGMVKIRSMGKEEKII